MSTLYLTHTDCVTFVGPVCERVHKNMSNFTTKHCVITCFTQQQKNCSKTLKNLNKFPKDIIFALTNMFPHTHRLTILGVKILTLASRFYKTQGKRVWKFRDCDCETTKKIKPHRFQSQYVYLNTINKPGLIDHHIHREIGVWKFFSQHDQVQRTRGLFENKFFD